MKDELRTRTVNGDAFQVELISRVIIWQEQGDVAVKASNNCNSDDVYSQ